MLKAAEILAKAEAIVAHAENESRALTDAELAEFNTLMADHAIALAAEQTAAQRSESESAARTAQLAEARAATDAIGVRRVNADRSRIVRPGAGEQPREFETFAEFCGAAVCNPRDPRLAALYRETEHDPRGEQRMDTGSTGGFMIPTQFRNQLLEVPGVAPIVRPRATVIPAGSPPDSSITMPALDQTGDAPQNVYGGVTVNWIAEGGAKPATDFALRQISLEPQEVAGYIPLTDKLLRNSAAAGALVARLLPAALLQAEDRAFLRGDGVGKPKGALVSNARYVQARAVANSVTYADLVEMESRLLGGQGVWVINRRMKPVILQIQDQSGGSPFVGAYIFSQITNTLLGHPVVWSERSPAKGAEGDVALCDFSYYLIKDGSGPFIASSEHVAFVNNLTYIKAFDNVDGRPWLTEPFKGEDGELTSPFVVLGA